jgi:hypothetical protein
MIQALLPLLNNLQFPVPEILRYNHFRPIASEM